jgi:ATPase subunit of ABC transporter with duplicated ATPase domains
LLGLNGCGKSTLLTAIGMREVPIPEHMDIYHLTREIDATDMSALEAVMNVDEERIELEKEVERLSAQVKISSLSLFRFSLASASCIFVYSCVERSVRMPR